MPIGIACEFLWEKQPLLHPGPCQREMQCGIMAVIYKPQEEHTMEALLYKADSILIREQFEITEGHQPQNALMIMKEGRFTCTFSEDSTFFAEPGDFVFFPMKRHFVRKVLEPCKFHLIYFVLSDGNPLCDRLPAGKVVFSDRQRVNNDAICFEEFLYRTDAFATAMKQHLLNDLFFQYCYDNAPAEDQKNTLSSQVKAIVRYFEEHAGQKITQQTLCDITGMSSSTLTRHFRKETGTSPMEYLIRFRLHNARKDMAQTRDTVGEIAARWGYENIYYFSNAFKKHFGYSPSEYRRNAPNA